MSAYQFAIQQKVRRAWIKPASAPRDLDCEVQVKQNPNGEVLSVRVVSCNGDAVVTRSIEAAVRKASPLPRPPNPLLFDADLVFDFVPGDQ
jgi:colicin import membrane protein